ncbi:MAG: potassium-transporting ATPase subunit KdpA [Planctomycetes bacterium]|nr:potassium-transporting ATPase subunit KdpA [Planctomycetota bacterium]
MNLSDWWQMVLFLALLLVAAVPLGWWCHRLLDGRLTLPGERHLLRLAGIDPAQGCGWQRYAGAVVLFNACGFAVLLGLLMLQGVLPGNPQGLPGLSWHLAFNTAVSFTTNTNWQSYGGESTMSYLSQALGLTVQNFLSAATGIAVMAAVARGFARQGTTDLGNPWVDLTRIVVGLLLPLSAVFAVVLVWQGVPQTWGAYPLAHPLAGGEQTIAVGPAAAQIAIKQLGTNGGAFFNANSAHPFENPTPLTNLLQCLAILAIPAGLCLAWGRLVADRRHGRALLWAMTGLLVAGLLAAWWSETRPVAGLAAIGADPVNLEGKEVRFGIGPSVTWLVATTAASNGSVNAMHASMQPLTTLVGLAFMQIGEVVFGGVGCGIYGMLLYVLVTVFVAGLMVGRTPELLGKRIEAREMKLTAVALLAPSAVILLGTWLAISCESGRGSIANPGASGFSEVLYALSSAAGNNGSAMAGLNANTPFWNLLLACSMLVGRFAVLVPVLALAGGLAAKPRQETNAGTLPTHGPLFIGLLATVVVLVGALTFLPALVLGPVAAHGALP